MNVTDVLNTMMGRMPSFTAHIAVGLILAITLFGCSPSGSENDFDTFLDRIDQASAANENGEYDKAIAVSREAIDLFPENPMPYMSLGIGYLGKAEYDQAITDFTTAITLAPTFGNAETAALATRGAYIGRASSYLGKREHNRAIADYAVVIALDPNNPERYLWRGNAYREMGEYDRAIADYAVVIALDPNNPERYLWRGNAYREMGNTTGR